MEIRLKRVYDKTDPQDGCRVLVDRLWPRGLSREEAAIDAWTRDIAPSDGLRKWYGHDPQKWKEFKSRYFAELDYQRAAINHLVQKILQGRVTLVFAAKEPATSNAAALKAYLESRWSRIAKQTAKSPMPESRPSPSHNA